MSLSTELNVAAFMRGTLQLAAGASRRLGVPAWRLVGRPPTTTQIDLLLFDL
jgi:hypothetical protein